MEKLISDVKPRGMASAYVVAPFDEGKEVLAQKGYKIISLQENVRLRVQEGKDSDISRYGNWTREGVLYVPGKGIFLTKNSPIMANAKEATGCHRGGKEFYLNDSQVEEALSDSVKLTRDSIPTNRFGSNGIADYAFGENAQEYGKFLREAGINEMPIWLTDLQEKAFVRQMWLYGLDGDSRSGLYGDNRYLDDRLRVRGVCDSAEGTAKNLEAYTPSQISQVLGKLKVSGLEANILTELKSIQ